MNIIPVLLHAQDFDQLFDLVFTNQELLLVCKKDISGGAALDQELNNNVSLLCLLLFGIHRLVQQKLGQ